MKNYDLMYILMPDLDDAALAAEGEALQKILTDNGAKITGVNTNDWGMRDLAYPIKKQTKGYYVVVTFSAEPVAVKEFNRIAALDPKVLRFLITVANN